MPDWLSYDWLRAIHIIFVIAWMAGMLMLPRLMVYQIEAEPGGETYKTMQEAIIRLRKIILTPSLVVVWVLGLLLIAKQWPAIMSMGWLYLKLAMVIGITGFHGWFVAQSKKIGTDKQLKPKTLRMLNEVPFIMAIIAVIAVVVQPFG
jgi:putative membrane protein